MAWSTVRVLPPVSLTSPAVAPISSTVAPASVKAFSSAASAAAAVPSVTTMPSLRPANESGPFFRIDRAGDSGRPVTFGRAGTDASGRGSPIPSATACARDSSTLRRLATMRSRISTRSHLPSSKAKALDDVLLLDRGLAVEELRRLAVVVGEGLGPDPAGLAVGLAEGLVALLDVGARTAVDAGERVGFVRRPPGCGRVCM